MKKLFFIFVVLFLVLIVSALSCGAVNSAEKEIIQLTAGVNNSDLAKDLQDIRYQIIGIKTIFESNSKDISSEINITNKKIDSLNDSFRQTTTDTQKQLNIAILIFLLTIYVEVYLFILQAGMTIKGKSASRRFIIISLGFIFLFVFILILGAILLDVSIGLMAFTWSFAIIGVILLILGFRMKKPSEDEKPIDEKSLVILENISNKLDNLTLQQKQLYDLKEKSDVAFKEQIEVDNSDIRKKLDESKEVIKETKQVNENLIEINKSIKELNNSLPKKELKK